jgi:hypothetical protein
MAPSPVSRRSTSPASPSIFNIADPRNYPDPYSFVPKSLQNDIFNRQVSKIEIVKQGFGIEKTSQSHPGITPRITCNQSNILHEEVSEWSLL